MLKKLQHKYRNISQHIKYKGVGVFFISKAYDYYQKFRFKKLGIYHPPRSGNLSFTSEKSLNKDSHENQPSSFYELREGFNKTKLNSSEISMIDIGCGEGRVMNFGMLLGFKRVFGIDLDEPALEKAAENCKKMQQQGFNTAFHVESADAALYNIPENINLFYLFNPFGEKTMEKFAGNLVNYSKKYRSELHVIYCVPDFRNVFYKYQECTKIFENQNKEKTDVYIAVFKINPS
jgi:SAM-dependent methyltransferase